MDGDLVRRALDRRCCCLAAITSCAVACSDPEALHVERSRGGVIHGEDTRRDVYELDDEDLAQLAIGSTVAFISTEHLASTSGGRFAVAAPTLRESNNLCRDEAFATQPAAATCSGVLIDAQLVLTAGHCVSDEVACGDSRLIFDYAMTEPDSPLVVDPAAVHRCKSIVVRAFGVDGDGRRLDHAVIELDRPVDPAREPVEVASWAPAVGSEVTVIGYPSGLPVKVDSGAQLLYASPCHDFFTISSDTFQASSGSGVFDGHGRLAGTFVRGGIDYEYVPERGCAVARRIEEVADPAKAEQASTITPAIEALCAAGWDSGPCAVSAQHRGDSSAGPDAGACLPATDDDDGPSGGCAIGHSPDGRPSTGALFAIATIGLLLRRGRRRARDGRGRGGCAAVDVDDPRARTPAQRGGVGVVARGGGSTGGRSPDRC